MTEMILGTVSFGLLVLFEYQKCRNTRQNITAPNPWFILGCLALAAALVLRALRGPLASGLQAAAGAVVLISGLMFYA